MTATEGKRSRSIPANMDSVATREQRIAYKLLIELLTYQFAFPVQWIGTQKEILAQELGNAQKIIEIGPAKVLASMAQKSAKRLVGASDLALSRERECLSIADVEDWRKIHYDYDNVGQSQPPKHEESHPKETVATTLPIQAPEISPVAITPIHMAPSTIINKDLMPVDVIIMLVAQKMRKAFDEVNPNESIQSLSGGKSTLQNELLGDLGAEFGDLPDGSESTTLSALGDGLPGLPGGKLGKSSKRLVERFLSAKMPGGFGPTELATYLASRWGLGPQSQLAVQCCCVTMEPPSRLTDAESVHAFLDTVVTRYAKHAGVSLPAPQSGSGASLGPMHGNAVLQVDNSMLETLKAQHNDVMRKQLHVLAQHLGVRIVQPQVAREEGDAIAAEIQQRLDRISAELDEEFLVGVQGAFDLKKERRYTSWWNWVREDAVRLLSDGERRPEGLDKGQQQRLQALTNRWTAELEQMLQYCAEVGPAKEVAVELLKLKPEGISTSPKAGLTPLSSSPPPVFRFFDIAMGPHTTLDEGGQIEYRELPRKRRSTSSSSETATLTYFEAVSATRSHGSTRSFVHCLQQSASSTSWQYDAHLTSTYHDALRLGCSTGLSYSGKTALVTGAGPGSIGFEVIRGLLAGGARVIATTSRSPAAAGPRMAQLYKECGGRGSQLVLLPFNAASARDVEALVAHIYREGDEAEEGGGGGGGDIDFVIPFAAIPESGREMDGLDAGSEVAHRAMLVNVLRLLGAVKRAKEQRGYVGRPTTAILPLSPNHGVFGGDGLYGESKIGLETLANRHGSEGWSGYVSVVGAVIGWTRGTGLMDANNIVARGIEDRLGVMTFTAPEMALNLLALLHPSMVHHADSKPVWADLSGGLGGCAGLKEELSSIRQDLTGLRRELQAIAAERKIHNEVLLGLNDASSLQDNTRPSSPQRRSNISQGFPKISSHQDMTADLESLVGMVDLSRTIVVVGFSELGPWGSSRTRWEMESTGQLSLDGLTELSWMMGLVKHQGQHQRSGPPIMVDGQPYVGWVDTVTGQPVAETEFAARYGDYIMSHCGIRALDPDALDGGYDPNKKELLHEVVLSDDLLPFSASETLAQSFKLRHGTYVDIFPEGADGEIWTVSVKRGATFLVPKASSNHQGIGAQLPRGWNAETYGVPADIVAQVDPITLYVLCCVCEAMYSAGIEDPYEFYQYIHLSELQNCIGSGAGGLKSMRDMYRRRYRDEPVQGDILQETFLNSMAAWTNMLLFGATGPIKTPTGTCATSVESLDNACEGIRSQRIKVALVGGTDDLQEEVAHEFRNMKATMVSEEETAKGYLPSQTSRPTASSRAGFVESAGCGIQIVMSAELALRMGLPIYAVIAYTQMAGDNVGRSVPAPGQGILTAARETPAGARSPLLDLRYRRSQLERELEAIEASRLAQLAVAAETTYSSSSSSNTGAVDSTHVQMVESAARCRRASAQWMWNGDLCQLDPSISPMRAALAVWGLTIDDVAVASFHGTSTKANDKNESSVINQQMAHLGRSGGNPLLVVCQKHLTGHPKGAAGAWMLNGCLQILDSGLVPGNKNLDDVDAALQAFPYLLYPSEAIHVSSPIKAFMLTSFGFGQKGGLVVGVTPRALFAAMQVGEFEKYRELLDRRQYRADGAFQLAMMTNSVFKAKDQGAWTKAGKLAKDGFLDPTARL